MNKGNYINKGMVRCIDHYLGREGRPLSEIKSSLIYSSFLILKKNGWIEIFDKDINDWILISSDYPLSNFDMYRVGSEPVAQEPQKPVDDEPVDDEPVDDEPVGLWTISMMVLSLIVIIVFFIGIWTVFQWLGDVL